MARDLRQPRIDRKYILDIRKILGDRPDKPEFIETVTKRGYRFIAPVVDESAAEIRTDLQRLKRDSDSGRAPPATAAVELKPARNPLEKFVLGDQATWILDQVPQHDGWRSLEQLWWLSHSPWADGCFSPAGPTR